MNNNLDEILSKAKILEIEHEHEGWPAIQMQDITAMREEIEKMRGLLLWVLWHHQGASSTVGQPIRKFLGVGRFDALPVGDVHHAKYVVSNLLKNENPRTYTKNVNF